MFKKTLIAAAVSMVATAPAFAQLHIVNKKDLVENVTMIANVSKQPALDFSTAVEDVDLRFDNGTGAADRELRNNGFLIIELNKNSGATFNEPEVRQWLTTELKGSSLAGLAVSTPENVVLDKDGKVVSGDESVTTSNLLSDLQRFFKTTQDGDYTTIVHNIDQDGTRIRIALTQTVEADVFSQALVDVNLSVANGIFKLVEAYKNDKIKDVVLNIGAQQNGSFTHDIQKTPAIFNQKAELFVLKDIVKGQATSLVDTFFENYKLGLDNSASNHDGYDSFPVAQLGEDKDIVGSFSVTNVTSNQNIQKNQVRLTMTGDFSGFDTKVVGTGNEKATVLVDKAGNSTGWTLTSAGTAQRLLNGTGTLQQPSEGFQNVDAILYNYTQAIGGSVKPGENNNDTHPDYVDDGNGTINGGVYDIFAEIGRFDTKNYKTQSSETDTYYPYTRSLAKIIEIDRDGMKFDTITTGSTSANKIFIRDVSNRLGTSGGKILVTAHEYDEKGNAVALTGKEGRKPLKTTLPSGGAVTLTPASIAAELGLDIKPNRQARFIFEVQTNQGEVAIKKSNSEGVDIKNGTRNVNQRNGDNGNLVDFTL